MKVLFGLIGVMVLGVIAWWNTSFPSGTWRYKMTVIVETPEGLKSGSAVREVFAWREPKILPEVSGGQIQLSYGEAVVVDLGSRGVLFALTTEDLWGMRYSKMLPFLVFSEEEGSLMPNSIRRFRTLHAGPTEVSPKWYPDFAYFKDINNRKTVTRVFASDLDKAFGDGVTLKSITLEMTKKPITKGVVDKYLPWLEPLQQERAQRARSTYSRRADPKEWEGAEDPDFAPAAIFGLKREGL